MTTPAFHNETVAAPDVSDIQLAKMPTPTATSTKPPKDTDPFLVRFAEPYDAENPLTWPASRKWMVTDVLSATGFNRIMVSTIMAPALTTIAAELHMSTTESAMSLSIYLLATAFGPLFIGPLSEIYGRQVILHGSSVWFLIWNVVCGFAETKGTLIAARFLAGFGASAIYALGGGVLGDVWRPEQRGKSLGIYLLIPLLGAAVGPIIGGFIASRTTWRWMFWATSIFQAVMIFVSFFSFYETYGALILRRRAARLRKETGNTRYYTLAERQDGERTTTAVLLHTLTRPVRLLLFHPIIQIQAAISAFNYGILTSCSPPSPTSGWPATTSPSRSAGCTTSPSPGEMLVGSQVGGYVMDQFYKRRQAHNRAPESRIPLMLPAYLVGWAGMLVYGWTAQYRVHWAIVDVGVVVMMFGMQMGGMPLTAYVIDSYEEHTSSAMAATQFIKSLTAFLFPLFAPQMYQALGYGWSNSILSLVGLVLSVPLLFLWRYGASLRAKATSTY
ncbi:MAG: hypothetical protein M1818_000018 [Claussenomyces sp. TS43310]|nr:MAG: hypothetical protein M1818_000018 [Claussenomyces sp. TS43310]